MAEVIIQDKDNPYLIFIGETLKEAVAMYKLYVKLKMKSGQQSKIKSKNDEG